MSTPLRTVVERIQHAVRELHRQGFSRTAARAAVKEMQERLRRREDPPDPLEAMTAVARRIDHAEQAGHGWIEDSAEGLRARFLVELDHAPGDPRLEDTPIRPRNPTSEGQTRPSATPSCSGKPRRLRNLEDRAGFRRDRLTWTERRIRAYVYREIRTRRRECVPLRTSRLAGVLGVHVNTIRAARDLLCDGESGIGYFRVVRALAGEPWEVTLGWKDGDELRAVARQLLEVRPRRPRRGRKADPSCKPICQASCEASCDPTCEGQGPVKRADLPFPQSDPKPRAPLSGDLRILGSKDHRGSRDPGRPPAGAPVASPSERREDRRAKTLRIWTGNQAGDGVRRKARELIRLAGELELDEPYVQQLVNTHAVGDLLPYVRQAAYGTDIRNPGGWLRRALLRAALSGELKPLPANRRASPHENRPVTASGDPVSRSLSGRAHRGPEHGRKQAAEGEHHRGTPHRARAPDVLPPRGRDPAFALRPPGADPRNAGDELEVPGIPAR